MSHEIRTPLNAIVGFSDVIGSTYDELSEEERADFVRLISINSEHLVRLIDDVLDLSKIESNTIKFTFTDCSLRSLMIDVEKEQTMKPISEIEIRASLPNEDVYINTDATRLKQVISNFINNARKFTEKDISILVMQWIPSMQARFMSLWKIQAQGFQKNAKRKYSTASIKLILSSKGPDWDFLSAKQS